MKKSKLIIRKILVNLMVFPGSIIAVLIAWAFTESEDSNNSIESVEMGFPVSVALPVFEKITEWDEYSGRFEASERVEVRARVGGFLESVNFVDGQLVKKGEVLFILDSRPYTIALDQAIAAYEQSKVSLTTAQENFVRVATLRESGAVSVEEYDRRKQALESAKASLHLSQARVDEAKLNLEFTKITAPISGLVSRDRVNPGNLIDGGSSNSTLLTTIVRTSPINFYFTGSEADFLRYVRLARTGERGAARSEGIPVYIRLQDEEEFGHVAKINFVENELDPGTGTIESRAVLENEDHLLEPGMFGKARILGSAEHDAIMVPDEVIGTNQSLRYVFVLDENNQIISKNVILGPLHSNGLRIIRDGLMPEDQVVINNLQKIRPGIKADPQKSTFKVSQ